ncbi:MAG: isopentenyl-diphosphate Delta-isomerase [Bacteroidetes bacterium]|nr:isopentenyl-diphosphate Delta-isomerase [Bacteroidota bacterium]MCK6610720.1 isopentenyl-diphosphate Delta-isomerase [Bacteroidia bacterium]
MSQREEVILVDEQDNEIGLMEKIEAHEKALLHRAFSVFVFNEKGELMLQQRALNKYHSGGLWTNTCCSHPRKGETVAEAAIRRLQEEMGFVCELELKHKFIYKAPFTNGLTEHELDYIFTGQFEGTPVLNPDEVESYRWISLSNLEKEIELEPEKFTIWFRIILAHYLHALH